MEFTQFEFRKANRFLPYIVLIGLGIGTANFILFGDLNWIQWIVQSLSTSFLIGYSTVLFALNRPWFNLRFIPKWKVYLIILVLLILIGITATEVEHMIRSLIFSSESFQPFSAGKMYLFNGVISLVLGLSLFQNNHLIQGNKSKLAENQSGLNPDVSADYKTSKSDDITSSIPVRQGENILLVPTVEIVYFEAYDNYSFLFDIHGQKRLCDYSLLFLEKRLDSGFSRIHRKYLVNEKHIKQIKPHINGRYIIEFSLKGLSPISSSKTYSDSIRRLIKIE